MILWKLRRLHSRDADTRRRAARSLSGLLKPRVFRALATVSNVDDAQLREAAQQSLEAINSRLKSEGAQQATRFLIKVLKKENDHVRAAAVEPLIEALKDSHAYDKSRPVAARLLGEIGDPRAVPALIAAFDASHEAERAIADALAKIGGGDALDALAQKLDDIGVHDHVAKRLSDVGAMSVRPLLILQLVSKQSWAREDAERIVSTLDQNWPQSAAAVQALPKLIEKCASDDYSQRKAAVKAVERINPDWWKLDDAQSLVPALIGLLASNGIGARDDGVRLIVHIGAAAVDPLIVALKNYQVRQRAAEALGKIGEAAVEPLIAALMDPDKDVRLGAVRAIKSLTHKPVKLGEVAVETLIAVLLDSDEDVRQTSAELLGKIDDIRAIEPLIKALSDIAESVRLAAANALAESADARVVGNSSVQDLIVEIKSSYEVSQRLRSSSPDSRGSSDSALLGEDTSWRRF